VPAIVAINEGMKELGYGAADMTRIESMQVLTQSIVAGSAEAGEADVVSALRASEAGADIRLTGLVYNSTTQVFVVNADKIKSYEDFKNTDNAIALNSTGDFIYVFLSGVMAKNGIKIDDTTIVEIGGSGSRMKALLGGRVAAVPVHFDQAAQIMKEGNYKVMIEPWKVYDPWISEGWLVNGKWLEKPDNQTFIKDVQKAMITSFRRANDDIGYFVEGYRKYATLAGAKDATAESMKSTWETISKEIKAWPRDGGFKREYFEQLLPVYREAGAIKADLDLSKIVDTQYVDKALAELGS
jgi:NitT/TauT family transport system substrate-binding protein